MLKRSRCGADRSTSVKRICRQKIKKTKSGVCKRKFASIKINVGKKPPYSCKRQPQARVYERPRKRNYNFVARFHSDAIDTHSRAHNAYIHAFGCVTSSFRRKRMSRFVKDKRAQITNKRVNFAGESEKDAVCDYCGRYFNFHLFGRKKHVSFRIKHHYSPSRRKCSLQISQL